MTNIDYDKLHSQLIKAVANNKGPEAVPEMKNVILAYLSQFSGSINHSINNLQYTADTDIDKFNGLSKSTMKKITTAGDNELRNLTQRIDRNLNQKQVDKIAKTTIDNHVAKITGKSTAQVNQYFSALDKEKDKTNQLVIKTNKLLNQLDETKDELTNARKDADKRFWYGTAITIIVTVCVCWLFL